MTADPNTAASPCENCDSSGRCTYQCENWRNDPLENTPPVRRDYPTQTAGVWDGMEISLLHIIAQCSYHDPAFIVGNRSGLTRLRDAIEAALSIAQAGAKVFAADGEGYGVHVRCVSNSEMDEQPFGYTEDVEQENLARPRWMRDAR